MQENRILIRYSNTKGDERIFETKSKLCHKCGKECDIVYCEGNMDIVACRDKNCQTDFFKWPFSYLAKTGFYEPDKRYTRFANARFERQSPSQNAIHLGYTNFLKSTDPIYYIHGNPGCGKSYALHVILRELLRDVSDYYNVTIIYEYDFFTTLKKSWDKRNNLNYDELISKVLEFKYILWDDFGSGFDIDRENGWAFPLYHQLLETVINSSKKLIITSNYSIEDLKTTFTSTHLKSRILDRLSLGRLYDASGTSFRHGEGHESMQQKFGYREQA